MGPDCVHGAAGGPAAPPRCSTAAQVAFRDAQDLARADLWDSTALSTMLPWQLESLRETEDLMGGDPWPMGFAANRHTVATLLDYLRRDRLIERDFSPEEVFAGPAQDFLLAT